MDDLALACMHLQHLLAEEEHRGTIASLADLALRTKQREEIQHAFAALAQEVDRYQRRLESLPLLPDRTCIQWAQQVLAYPNARLLVVDTTFPGESAVVVQVLVLDLQGERHFHQCVPPNTPRACPKLAYLGIDEMARHNALPLPQIWPALLAALHGGYLLVAGLRQARMALESEALRSHLETPVLIGEDLFPWW